MRKRTCLFLAFLLIIMLSFSGCKISLLSPHETMRAPNATGYLSGVQQALEKAVDGEIILKYPISGDDRSALCVHDIDHDDTDEIVAFYQLRSEGETTRINLLRYIAGEWVSVQDLGAVANDIDQYFFIDLDGDGIDEFVTGWKVTASSHNKVILYSFQKGLLVQRASEDYTEFVVTDINNDGISEFCLLKLDSINKISSLIVYQYVQTVLTAIGTVSLDGNVISYDKININKLPDGTPALYFDANKDSATLITELVYFKNGLPFDPFVDQETLLNTMTIRYTGNKVEDMNNDGILDIPKNIPICGNDLINSTDKQYLITWNNYDGEKFNLLKTTWYSHALGCSFEFDNSWSNNINVMLDNDSSYAVFSIWNSALDAKGEEIFRIRRFTADEWNNNKQSYYIGLDSNASYVWATMLSDRINDFGLNKNNIGERFKIIDN